jgi:hypothetical protein
MHVSESYLFETEISRQQLDTIPLSGLGEIATDLRRTAGGLAIVQSMGDYIVDAAEDRFETARERFRDTELLGVRRDKASEALYIHAGATTETADVARTMALETLNREFALKDFNRPQDITHGYDPSMDDLVLTASHASGQAEPSAAIHNQRQRPGKPLSVFEALEEDWGEEREEFLGRIGLRHLLDNPRVMEIVSVASVERYRGVPTMAAYNLTCINNRKGKDYFVAALDRPAADMLNRFGNGFRRITREINFHAPLRPDANRTAIYVCDLEQWRRKLLATGGKEGRLYKQFWGERANTTFKRYSVIDLY